MSKKIYIGSQEIAGGDGRSAYQSWLDQGNVGTEEQFVASLDGVGIQSVTQTTTSDVDGGTNVITVTKTDGTSSTFSVNNGRQGNSGYSGAAGELEVVNNVTSGGATKALSAEMGKELKGDIDQLGLKVDENDQTLLTTPLTAGTISGKYINNGVLTANSGQTTRYCKVKKGERIRILANNGLTMRWGIFANIPATGDTASSYGQFSNSLRNDVVAASDGYLGVSYYTSSMTSFSMSSVGKIEQLQDASEDVANTIITPYYRGDLMIGTDGKTALTDNSRFIAYIPVVSGGKYRIKVKLEQSETLRYAFYTASPSVASVVSAYFLATSNPVLEYQPSANGYLAFSATKDNFLDASFVETSYLWNKVNENSAAISNIDVSQKVDIKLGKNLFNKDADGIVEGKFIDSVNAEYPNANYNISEYIPISPSTNYYLSADGDEAVSGSGARHAYYDADKVMLSLVAGNTKSLTSPATAAFIRISYKTEYEDTTMLNKGTTRGDYQPYSPIGGYPSTVDVTGLKNAVSTLGSDASKGTAASMSDGDSITLSGFPYHCFKGLAMSFYADITSFSKIIIGKGLEQYRGEWLEIDGTNIVQKELGTHSASETYTVSTNAHGLTLSTFVKVSISCNYAGKSQVVLQTLGGYYRVVLDWGYQGNYAAFVKSVGSSLTNCTLNATSTDFRLPVWIFGDSYLGVNNNRWVGCLKNFGYFNFLLDNLAGIAAANSYADLQRALKFGCPKYLLWALGANNYSDLSVAISTAEQVIAIGEDLGITVILFTIPNMPERDFSTYNTWVKSSGERYIDIAKAVGDPVYESGVNHWYGAGTANDYLSADKVHPTAKGAQAMATQVLVDFPEIMQYGLYSDDTSLDDTSTDQ